MARSGKVIINGITFSSSTSPVSKDTANLLFEGRCGNTEELVFSYKDMGRLHKLLGLLKRKENAEFGHRLRSTVHGTSTITAFWDSNDELVFDVNDIEQTFSAKDLKLIICWVESVMALHGIKHKSLLTKPEHEGASAQMPVVFADANKVIGTDIQCFVDKQTDGSLMLQLEDDDGDTEFAFSSCQLVEMADYLQDYIVRNKLRPAPKKAKSKKAKPKKPVKKPVRNKPPKGVSPAALAS